MVIGIIGESCTGKSTLADQLKRALQAQVFTGKDYLRLAKGEALAQNLFRKKLEEAAPDEHILYVVSEAEHLQLLPENAIRILVTADLETIKERFARRMRGNMPAPVAAMLEGKHGCFDGVAHDLHLVSRQFDPDEVCALVERMIADASAPGAR